ncbi:acetyl-CoA synthetase [Mameliella alba]|uniref:AMP-binding protein n=1 Tax=Mameliella alba TaxID=561184 RepID=UPI00088F5993|nr:AMP-binding protein [Mameliella alba]OWV49570.1 AMP-dependent synthetase [Mameliella alba]PTR41546.1 acetyl-CoA synthetase [Mameliella alba]GGF52434.1 acetyl-CoA synthetase [Mameliella alba]SDC38657.1 acetyl-CoA synthetase [Mameliella alba]
MLKSAPTYDALRAGFRWDLPARLNMAEQACDLWARRDPDRVAILDHASGAAVTYGALAALSRRVQAALLARGVGPGDRVGVLLSQSPLCAAAHLACWRMGAISVPLFMLFREDALRSRLSDSGAGVVVTDAEGAGMLAPFDLEVLREDELPPEGAEGPAFDSGPETPAVLIYTSGTTGTPKGALHGHRVLTGHLPGVEMSHDFLGQPGDVLWTPADWAWIGGLFDVLMPGLALGVPVVAARMRRFDVDECTRIVSEHAVRNVFFPPTALRILKAADARITGLRSVASGGEPLGAEMLAWGRAALGVTINEFYGQTECNMVASSCAALFDPIPGALGRAVPGFDIAVIDEDGSPVEGEGDIAVRRGCASMMLEYWNRPGATAEKFRGDWLVTGDRGRLDAGFIRFVGREDDVITSAGYRIGPAEIEDCLLTHPGVATVGVVGKPDPLRTEIVKAYVVRKPGVEVDAGTLQAWVKDRLASYSYPREISFLDALPMTVTGKVIRKELKARAAAETAQE